MCNLYTVGDKQEINKHFRGVVPTGPYKPTIAPLGVAPIITDPWQLKMAQWGMIPSRSPTRVPTTSTGNRMSTQNARRETIATAFTYRDAWAKSRRCLIPANSYDEPYWGSGKNVWWRFWRADGTPWALAGIWSEWTDPQTGEVVTNYSMITQNCDGHPLLSLMHKPDGAVPPDKRAVVPIEPADWDCWLTGTVAQAEQLIQLPDEAIFRHSAAEPVKQATLNF